MTAGVLNFTVERGIQFQKTLTITENGAAYDLTNFTAKMQLREQVNSSSALLTLTSGSGLTLGGTAGTIIITIPAAQSNAIDVPKAVYDLQLTNGSSINVLSLVGGTITFKQKVTRDA